MEVTLSKDGLTKTWQADFPDIISESHRCRGATTDEAMCDGESRIAFVAHEGLNSDAVDKEEFICHLHENKYDEGKAWLHDCCAVAIYFCKKCLKATAHWNQG